MKSRAASARGASAAGHRRPFWERLSALLIIAYVGFAALRAEGESEDARAALRSAGEAVGTGAAGGGSWGWLALGGLLFAFAAAWGRVAPPRPGENGADDASRRAMRACIWGASLFGAASLGPEGPLGLRCAGALGVAIAIVAALAALARVQSLGGLLEQTPVVQRFGAAAQAGLLGACSVAAPLLGWAPPGRVAVLDRDSAEAVLAASQTALLGLTLVAAGHARARRRLELGAAERGRAAFAAAMASMLLGSAAVTAGVASFTRALDLSLLGAAFGIAGACVAPDPARLSRAQRYFVVFVGVGAPLAFASAAASMLVPGAALGAALVSIALALSIGFFTPALASPLAPEQSRWLEAIAAAERSAARGEPATAIASVLTELRALSGAGAPSAELFRLDPPGITKVDLAGYTHEEPGSLPPMLFELCAGEPERVLRLEALEALEIRRADVRPVAAWMRERHACCIVWLGEKEMPAGALVVPAGTRAAPLTLEEARALRSLGDSLAALVLASATIAGSHARAVAAVRRAEEAEQKMRHTEVVARRDTARHEAAARRLARPALIAAYSPAARLCMQQLEIQAADDRPITLLTPVGADPLPYAAVAHLASRRKGGQLFVVDASDRAEHSADEWSDSSSSPLALAQGGTLVVLCAPSLPEATQALLARAVRDRRFPGWDTRALDLLLVVSAPATVDVLAASGRIVPELADCLGDRAVPIPPLSARAEDLRALLLDRLARAGMKWRGRPIGIDPTALARLLEHEWPGNDLELDEIVARAAATVTGDVLTGADLDRLGFAAAGRAAMGGAAAGRAVTPAIESRPIRARRIGTRK